MHGSGLYDYGFWVVVIINTAIFILFALSFLKPQKKIEWRSFGALSAFFAALFAEMYGFPLTIYLLASYLGNKYPAANPFGHDEGHLLILFFGGSKIAFLILHTLSNILIFAGFVLIWMGWAKIYKGKGGLVTDGIYAYLRHPQYLGLYLIILGFLIQWPTLVTLLMSPVLFYVYYRLALREESDLEKEFGEAYLDYRKKTPGFIPRLSR